MDRRAFVTLMGGSILARPLAAEAQPPPKVAKIGLLTPSSPAGSGHLVEAFRQGFRQLGYIEGQTFVLQTRYGDGKSERLADLARELVRWKADVIVTSTDVATAAVRRQTRTMPIVMALSTDPVGTGFVASLARPGGNVTGLAYGVAVETIGKGLELLNEAVPKIRRVAVLSNPANPGTLLATKDVNAAARSQRRHSSQVPTA